ncbi:hypothetical protein Hsero_0557 [Herbaspirillum seropedicae SmR1]|uniref:Uncharacterized protein n=1 Tax=Herbaspirillum seropedicae (strain SmR1) TaxID=757424 RepID=D8IYB6_HERSS|nr:hypothetical protein Hsero_0557 [Herbaspirillum seropedicae SmR1]
MRSSKRTDVSVSAGRHRMAGLADGCTVPSSLLLIPKAHGRGQRMLTAAGLRVTGRPGRPFYSTEQGDSTCLANIPAAAATNSTSRQDSRATRTPPVPPPAAAASRPALAALPRAVRMSST